MILARNIESQSIPAGDTVVQTLDLSTGIYLITVWFTDSNSSGVYVNLSTLGGPLSAVTNGATSINARPYVAIIAGTSPFNITFTNPGATTTIAGTVLVESVLVQ